MSITFQNKLSMIVRLIERIIIQELNLKELNFLTKKFYRLRKKFFLKI